MEHADLEPWLAHMATHNVGTAHLGIENTARNHRKSLGIEYHAGQRIGGEREVAKKYREREGEPGEARPSRGTE